MDQINLDTSLVKEFFARVDIQEPEFKISRLGKFDPTSSRSRPVKVQLSSEAMVHKILKNSRKITTTDKWKGISFSRDRTTMQRELHRVMKQNLHDRLNAGEKYLTLKYINGIPSIVSSEN
ncbi:hypothetical protein QE152_g26107 [Popillia japonica]|uniref:Uncharacterized protein n=1 Tax=Popillia japonica TaxID=7064 RepID=A0AAW1K0K5_POPJA